MDWKITNVSNIGDIVTIKAEAEVPIEQFASLVNDLPTPEPAKPKKKAKKKKPGKKTKHKAAAVDKKARQRKYYLKHQAKKEAAEKAASGPDDEISDKKMAKMQEIDNGIKKVQKQQDDIYRKERP